MSELHPTHQHHAPTSAASQRADDGKDHPRLESPSHGATYDRESDLETDAGVGYTFDPDAPVLVSIRWKDAESQGGPTWEDTDEMLEFARRPLTIVLTVGVLLHMDHEQVAVTDTVALDQMGGVTKIPRGWIEEIEELGPVPSRVLDRAEPGGERLDPPSRRVG